MKVVIIKYNAGNIFSVDCALRRIGVDAVISDDPALIRAADRVIFPGVGEASTTMNYLRSTGLDQVILSLKQPVLGICIGQQLLCSHSEEGDTPCLGFFEEKVVEFRPTHAREKIPQMGWNTLENTSGPLFEGIEKESYVYYVHSFYAEIGANTIASTNYILPFSAALHKDNFYSVQFHPEKSGRVGEKILRNFIFGPMEGAEGGAYAG